MDIPGSRRSFLSTLSFVYLIVAYAKAKADKKVKQTRFEVYKVGGSLRRLRGQLTAQ